MKILKLNCFVIVSFVMTLNIKAQVTVSELIQESEIVTTDSNALYFVDFWATWCGPCVYAKKMLTVLQKEYPEDFYVISISDESADKIRRYLLNKPSKLAIAVDEQAITFSRYNILSRPNGILFNSNGDKLWQGHPSDLSPQLINKFLRQNKSKKSLVEFLNILKIDRLSNKDYVPVKDFEIIPSINKTQTLEVSFTNSYLSLDGSLLDILSYVSKVSETQIKIAPELNSNYKIFIKQTDLDKYTSSQKILDELGLTSLEESSQGEVISLQIKEQNFWDTNQINWGDVKTHYLVSDSDIQADNVSLKDLSFELSKVLNLPVIIINEDQRSSKVHDWQVHYKYFNFMSNNFLDYGIEVKKEKSKYPSYTIIKKAP